MEDSQRLANAIRHAARLLAAVILRAYGYEEPVELTNRIEDQVSQYE